MTHATCCVACTKSDAPAFHKRVWSDLLRTRHVGATGASAQSMNPLIASSLLLASTQADAHGNAGDAGALPYPWLLILLGCAAIAYGHGLSNVWRSAGRGHGVSVGAAVSFFAGLALLAVLVCEPVERYTNASFAAHMAQHELLMLVVAPLLVLGRPLATWTWALPRSARAPFAHVFATPVWRIPWNVLTSPLGATGAQLVSLFIWHAPRPFDAAVASPWLHALQHASFLAPALAFWWAVLAPFPRAKIGPLVGALFLTMLGTGALGALLTFSNHPWYDAYATRSDPLADQQLGGLLMGVPGGIAYLGATLWILGDWLRRSSGSSLGRMPH